MHRIMLAFAFNTSHFVDGMFKGFTMMGIIAAIYYFVNRKKK